MLNLSNIDLFSIYAYKAYYILYYHNRDFSHFNYLLI